MGRTRLSSVALAAVLGVAGVARAGGNDFRLNATSDGKGIFFARNGAFYEPQEDRWKSLVRELGYSIAPRGASPAETLGHAGFGTGLLWSGTVIASDQPYWQGTEIAQTTGEPNGMLQTLQFDVRKGLPMSFELGVNLVWLIDSELFAPGFDLRWAVTEGFKYLPDFGVRASLSHVVGHRDLNLTVIGFDATLSKGFGISGVVHIAPYLSWSVLLMAASSRVIDPTPAIEDDVGLNLVLPTISPGDKLHQKLTVGARLLFYVLHLSFQGELEILGDTPTGTQFFGPLFTMSTKLGLEF